jgi:hypothetical protein
VAGVAAGSRGGEEEEEEEVREQDRRGPEKRHAPKLRGENHPHDFQIYTRHLATVLSLSSLSFSLFFCLM